MALEQVNLLNSIKAMQKSTDPATSSPPMDDIKVKKLQKALAENKLSIQSKDPQEQLQAARNIADKIMEFGF